MPSEALARRFAGSASARVVHHVLLVSVAAALIVGAFAPRPVAERSTIAWSTAAQAIVFWLWHAPPVYAWALSNDSAYWLMQASLLASAGAVWAMRLKAA